MKDSMNPWHWRGTMFLPAADVQETSGLHGTNRATAAPEGTRREGLCSCPTPLIWDKETGEWLHLATMSRCPKRLERRP